MSTTPTIASIRADKMLDKLIEKNGQIDRLSTAVHKLTKWAGVEISELIDEGYLEEGDVA